MNSNKKSKNKNRRVKNSILLESDPFSLNN